MRDAKVMEEDIQKIMETETEVAAALIGVIIQVWLDTIGLKELTEVYNEIGRKYEVDGNVLKVEYEGTWYKALLPEGGSYVQNQETD